MLETNDEGHIIGRHTEGTAKVKLSGKGLENKIGNISYSTSGFQSFEKEVSVSDWEGSFNVSPWDTITLSTSTGESHPSSVNITVSYFVEVHDDGSPVLNGGSIRLSVMF